MRTSLVTAVLTAVVVLATTTPAPADPAHGGRHRSGDTSSACGAGSSAAHCTGIFDLTSDRAMRARLAAR